MPERARLEFLIGRSFPADEPVARFLTVLAMMNNDLRRLLSRMFDGEMDEGERIFYFRLLASAFFEASTFLSEAIPRWRELQEFVGSLGDGAREELQRVAGACDPKSEFCLGPWVKDHRNVTFHYSEMHPERAAAGKEEIGNALLAAADIDGSIAFGEGVMSVMFSFADDVAVQWLPDGNLAESKLEMLRERHVDLVRFTERAFHAYLNTLRGDARAQPIGF